MDVYSKIIDFLNKNNIEFKSIEHEATYTSEESARVRGEDLSIGGKAILMKCDNTFNLFVISASNKLDSKRIRDYLKCKKCRFATKEELSELTNGLVPGSVPPFGRPIFNFDLYVDESINNNEKIAFNAGSLCKSIIMKSKDYLLISNAKLGLFS
jgi:Ala-tRNA(Pro) deacylase